MSKEPNPGVTPATMTGKNDFDSKEYNYGIEIATKLRDNSNQALGDLLTTVEAVLPEGQQLEALKQLIKQRIWLLTDTNQHQIYRTLEVEK